MAVVTDLVTRFSFKGSTQPLTAFNSALSNSVSLFTKSTLAIGAASTAMLLWVNSIARASTNTRNLHKETGLSVESIQSLRYAIIQSGGDAKGMESILGGLSAKIGNAALYGDDSFSQMGISVRKANGELKTSEEMLFEIGRRLRDNTEISDQEKMSLARGFGIDATTFKMITQSDAAIASLMEKSRKMGGVTSAQSALMERYNAQMGIMGERFEHLKTMIAIELMPTIADLGNQFLEFVNKHGPEIRAFISDTVKVVKDLTKAFKELSPEAKTAIAALAGLAVVSTMINPLTMFAAAVTGVVFAVKDLNDGFSGGKSNINEWIKKNFDVDLIKGISDALAKLRESWEWWNNVAGGNVIRGFNFVTGSNVPVQDYPTSKVPVIQQPKISDVPNLQQLQGEAAFRRWQQDPSSDVPPAPPVINQNVQIEINTNDARQAGQSVRDALNEQLTDAYRQSARGKQ